MKQLLGMAREKKEKDGGFGQKQVSNNINLLQKNKQPPPKYQPPSESEHQYQEADGYNDQEIFSYAQFLGIKLPQEEDLLWIAEEGIYAELPQDWINENTEDNQEVVYYNTKTGQRTDEHPCDQYYKQLVIQERRKKGGNKMLGNKKPVGMQMAQNNDKSFPIKSNPSQQMSQQFVQPKPVVIDPLLKMQQQKQLKRLEDSKKKQFQEKKNSLISKNESKKQDLLKELKEKEQKLNKKYKQQLAAEKEKQLKKMSQKQRQNEQKMNRQLKNYETETKLKLERAQQERMRKQKQIIQNKMRAKKEDIKKQLENQLKKSKQQIQQQFKDKIKIIQDKERKLNSQNDDLDSLLQNEIKKLKNEIIRKKMKQHSQRIKAENDKQKDNYMREISQLQILHDQKISELQRKQPKNKIKMDELIKQCQKQEEEQMESFNYELQHLKKAKQFQNQEKIEEFKNKILQEHRKGINRLIKEYDQIYEKYRNLKTQQYESYIWETERKSKEEYIRSLKALEKKFNTEEQIALIQNIDDPHRNLERESLVKMNTMIDNLSWEQKQAKRELQNIRLEIENMRSQNLNVGSRMNENQMKLFQLIQDKIKSRA